MNPIPRHSADITKWLPITREEIEKRGWERPDVIIVSGDAYVDHPSFGAAVIGRVIESRGYRVAILPQPNWRDDLRDFKKLGEPRLFFGVTAGNMDSMVNHYTAAKRLRSDDAYTPGGKVGFRPDNASVVYCMILKQLYPNTPVVLGGVEASMRRITYYDYWENKVRPSILIESGADLLINGMAEYSIMALLERMEQGMSFPEIQDLPQSAYLIKNLEELRTPASSGDLHMPPHNDMLADKALFANTFKTWETEINRVEQRRMLQPNNEGLLVINPDHPVLSTPELDTVYDLPYTRQPHPKYLKRGPIPAYEMIKHSLAIHRGCFGGCSFCTLAAHQGKFISSRSKESILKEVEKIVATPGFKGHITDLGGPSANMYRMVPIDLQKCKKCSRASCIYPSICNNLNTSHQPLIELYRRVRLQPDIKKVSIGSGIRYDLFMHLNKMEARVPGNRDYFEELVVHHVSGRLKVAPEHTSDRVLKLMRKQPFHQFAELKKEFDSICRQHHLHQQLIPYFISSHPGSEKADMAELADKTRQLGYHLEQVQDFTPTPLTLATTMYYTGLNPYTMQPVYVARTDKEKQEQRQFFFWYKEKKTSSTQKRHIGGKPSYKNASRNKENPKKSN
ncbi:MAG: YgiQ family radical SAM protein [Bacteroidales bacterium]|nr:YgiQ family radical SAM protein [Bacteroidales bacterium]MDZ4205084.1 YgiQ family radical SAM protein [Bacteroidales bacterium]